MDATQASSAPTPAATPTPAVTAQTPDQSTSALSSDFETFLKMLTTQMKNQDPLNPVDSADFALQLATFSSVEQQVKTNDILGTLGDQLGALGIGQLLGWIGMTARAEMPVVFDGAPVPMTLTTQAGASSAKLIIKDETGTVVQSQNAPPEGGEVVWAGVGDGGQPLNNGTYTAEVESYAGDTLLATHPVILSARIVEARSEASGTVLIMDTGQHISASKVQGLRE